MRRPSRPPLYLEGCVPATAIISFKPCIGRDSLRELEIGRRQFDARIGDPRRASLRVLLVGHSNARLSTPDLNNHSSYVAALRGRIARKMYGATSRELEAIRAFYAHIYRCLVCQSRWRPCEEGRRRLSALKAVLGSEKSAQTMVEQVQPCRCQISQ